MTTTDTDFPVKVKVDILFKMIQAFEEMIALHGSNGIPSGELYAIVMGDMSLTNYQLIISALIESGRITADHYLLKINPNFKPTVN